MSVLSKQSVFFGAFLLSAFAFVVFGQADAQQTENSPRSWRDVGFQSGEYNLECEYRALVDNNGTDMMYYPSLVSKTNLYFFNDTFTTVIMSDTRNIIIIPGGHTTGGYPHTVRRLEKRC